MKKIISSLCVFIAIAITVISCSSNDDTPLLSSLATIEEFTITIEGLTAEDITYDLGTDISVTVPFGTSLAAVTPTIILSDKATVSPITGIELEFIDGEPTRFTVTAEDRTTTKEYKVTINTRGEIGSGSKLKTYKITDAFRSSFTNTYIYNNANFVSEIFTEEVESGNITITTFIYNDKNQIIEEKSEDISTIFTYENDLIKSAVTSKDNSISESFTYEYNTENQLVKRTTTNHDPINYPAGPTVDDIETYAYDNEGNVIEYNRGTAQTNITKANYDTKNNPFKGIYPTAYAKTEIGIDALNTNNPVTREDSDNGVTYQYNLDDYPVTSVYTYFDGFVTVEKTFTYYAD